MNLPPELLFKALLNMDFLSMARFCRTSPEIYQICQDEFLWRQKVQRKYGVTQYIPIGMTFQEQYKSLYLLPPVIKAINNGRLDQIIVLIQKDAVVTPNNLSVAAEHGHIHILDYFAQLGILPDERAYHWAARSGRINVLDWLWNHGLVPDGDTASESNANFVEVLVWLENHGVVLNEWTPNYVTNSIEVLEWLEKEKGWLPTFEAADFAAGRGNMEMLEWMVEREIYPTEEGMINAAVDRHLETIKWMVSRLGMKPTSAVARAAAYYGHSIEILDYLEELGVIPNSECADDVIQQMNYFGSEGASIIEILDWLAIRDIYPTQRGIFYAINSKRIDILKWLVDHNIKPTVSWAHQAARGGNTMVLEWLASYGIKPRKS